RQEADQTPGPHDPREEQVQGIPEESNERGAQEDEQRDPDHGPPRPAGKGVLEIHGSQTLRAAEKTAPQSAAKTVQRGRRGGAGEEGGAGGITNYELRITDECSQGQDNAREQRTSRYLLRTP